MTYKIRRFKSKVQACKGMETNTSGQLRKQILTLKSEIENLTLELRCQSFEMAQIKSSRDVEREINSLIMSVFVSNSDENQLNDNLASLDVLINTFSRKLLDVFHLITE
ncbi:hypothetical protein NIES4071_88030 [Calothrix sp. NIES-4071]|nr:hypothetical protein NIES4071_88030 [Calothrix sp. NIES-4071]BAZ63070.1 hypothetical protein NIES4105_87960 [Calothrix sp. NIES-4105]